MREEVVYMKKTSYYLYAFFGRVGIGLLFLLDFIYVFTAIGLFALGIIVFPCSALGVVGVLSVVSDIAFFPLLLMSLGVLLLGLGMCLGIFPVCRSTLTTLRRFMKSSEHKRRHALYE